MVVIISALSNVLWISRVLNVTFTQDPFLSKYSLVIINNLLLVNSLSM